MFPLNSIVINLLLNNQLQNQTNYKILYKILYVYRGVTKKKIGPLKYCLGRYISYKNINLI